MSVSARLTTETAITTQVFPGLKAHWGYALVLLSNERETHQIQARIRRAETTVWDVLNPGDVGIHFVGQPNQGSQDGEHGKPSCCTVQGIHNFVLNVDRLLNFLPFRTIGPKAQHAV